MDNATIGGPVSNHNPYIPDSGAVSENFKTNLETPAMATRELNHTEIPADNMFLSAYLTFYPLNSTFRNQADSAKLN